MTELDLELSAPAPASARVSAPIHAGLRELVRVRPASVAILTGRDIVGTPWGWPADWFTAISFDPATIAISLPVAAATDSRTGPGRAALLNLLPADQSIANRPAGPIPWSEAMPAHRFTVDGIPVITGATGAARCRVDAVHPAGDRRLLVARIERVQTNPAGSPLVRLDGGAARHLRPETLETKEPT